MKNTIILVLTSTILTIVSAQMSWPKCIPPDTPYKWYTATTTSGLIHYTSTKRNVRWPDADPTCRNMVPGFSKVAEVKSRSEWKEIKKVVGDAKPNWYWFKNQEVTRVERNIRHFHFSGFTRLYDTPEAHDNCMVYVYPGSGTTDIYCGMEWARALCEVRCT